MSFVEKYRKLRYPVVAGFCAGYGGMDSLTYGLSLFSIIMLLASLSLFFIWFYEKQKKLT